MWIWKKIHMKCENSFCTIALPSRAPGPAPSSSISTSRSSSSPSGRSNRSRLGRTYWGHVLILLSGFNFLLGFILYIIQCAYFPPNTLVSTAVTISYYSGESWQNATNNRTTFYSAWNDGIYSLNGVFAPFRQIVRFELKRISKSILLRMKLDIIT